ncbi:aldehyde dehydrogenase family protein [Salinigranum sp. GCM10025319]|uniref:aldehyde dehydrogenase family protein n=1 Tax=Salinigranum sp. GCM10025319 TaxID=3252687 RepID=UPI00360A6552
MDLSIEDRMYIDGEFCTSGETFETLHPPTEAVLAEIPVASDEQVDRAARAAARASREWRTVPMPERRAAAEAVAERIEAHKEELVRIEVADNGSSISRFAHDIDRSAEAFRYYGGLGKELKGETIPTEVDELTYTVREPYGAVAAIIPFNHPAMFAADKLAPAVMAGNGVVLKPSEVTPLSALYLAWLVDDLDVFPDGLVNVVTGEGETGATLVRHPSISFVNMIGSVETGRLVMQGAAEHISPVKLELGGKNPAIVFPDVDPERAAEGAVSGMSLAWQGQSCGSGSRLLVHADVYEEVVPRVVEGFEAVGDAVGDPFDEATRMGSVISDAQYEKILHYIETAKDEGATLLTGGSAAEGFETGYFVEPTVFEVDPEMTIACEEIFGPVLSILEWDDYDEMIDLANSVEYGLTASIWTDDLPTAHKTASALDTGYIWINQHGRHYLGVPFGGYKQSGIGKNEGFEELLDHTQVKTINLSLAEE